MNLMGRVCLQGRDSDGVISSSSVSSSVSGVLYLGGQQLLLGIDLLLLSGCQILQVAQRHVQTRS